MSTTGIVQHRDALRPCCPEAECGSFNIKLYKGGTGRCYSCGAPFAKPLMRQAMKHRRPTKELPVEKPKKAGSGVFPEPRTAPEAKPLTYDMMSHMRLAMVGRR